MKILRVLAPSAEPELADHVREGVAEFNRGLDIRLRFLAIGVEDSEVVVEEPESAAEIVAEAMAAAQPTVVLVHGDDSAALAAATIAARSDAVIAHVGAGVRSGLQEGADADTARAIDHVCGLLLAIGPEAVEALAEEGLQERTRPLERGPELGHQVIKALRAERVRRRGDSTC